ncbi:MAG: excinuclease ABC subunit UvrC [Bacteroidales bacterium]
MSEPINERLNEIVRLMPEKPGVYEFFNKEGIIIYVGKAKELKRRVSSYFSKYQDSAKTKILVRNIFDIKYIIVDTEADALLLENNLIKKYQPRYNVLLKDDKTYPWICIKNENFPRVFFTRTMVKDGSIYFGPFTSLGIARTVVEFARQLYQIRTCKLYLTKSNISQKKFKVCLEYHIGNCKAPCVGLQSEEEYNDAIEQIQNILKGNTNRVIQVLKQRMFDFSEKCDYEEAQKIKEKLDLLENYQSKSSVVSSDISDVDVYSVIVDELNAYVNFLKVVNGSIIQVHTFEIKKKLDETKEDLLTYGILASREKFNSISKEVIVPFIPDFKLANVKFIVPVKGDKKKLLELSEKNVKFYRLEKKKQEENIDPNKHANRILNTLKEDLHLQEIPVHIECFDNSNIQGEFPVAACVVFKNGKPSKNDYRHFNIKTVSGPNDFASMEEIVYRRYRRQLDEGKSIPQLVIIDGGKGQLSSAMKSIEALGLKGKTAVIGIAKKLEEIYFPGDSVPIYLNKNSESLKIIQKARDEAHRFGITFHRNKRSQNFIDSGLLSIKGISNKTSEILLSHFGSIDKIKAAKISELSELIGGLKADLIFRHFHG